MTTKTGSTQGKVCAVLVWKAEKRQFRSQIQSSKRGNRNQDGENDENSFRARRGGGARC